MGKTGLKYNELTEISMILKWTMQGGGMQAFRVNSEMLHLMF